MIPLFDGKRRLLLAGLITTAICQVLVALVLAWCVQNLFDRLMQASQGGTDEFSTLLFVSLSTLLSIPLLEIAQRRTTEAMGLSFATDLRLLLFRHMLRLPPRTLLGKRPGVLLLPFVGDLTATRQWVSDGIARGIVASATIFLILAWLAASSIMVAALLSAILALFLVSALLIVRPLDKAVREVRKHRGILSGFVSGRIAAVSTISSMARERTEVRKVAGRTAALNTAVARRAWVVGGLRGLVHFTTTLLVLAILFVGGIEVSAGKLTAGQVIGALSLMGLLGSAIRDLGRALELWIPGKVSLERIAKILHQPVRKSLLLRGPKRSMTDKALSIQKLTINGVLSQVSADAEAGDVILVDGLGGSGKSSLIGVLAGLIDPDRGDIFYKGKHLSRFAPAKARRTIGFASPMVPLLSGSIRMNLRYRHPKVRASEVDNLVSLLGVDGVIGRQAGGMNHVMSDPIGDLSTGEYQALIIVRAILGFPPILLLDSVDSHLSDDVLNRLVSLLADYPGIVIFSATRPQLAAVANRRWRIDGTQLVEAAKGPQIVTLNDATSAISERQTIVT